jgi:hypothetical protein
VDIGSPLTLTTSAMRMPLRPRDAITRSIPTTRSMLWVPLLACSGASMGTDAPAGPFARLPERLFLVSTMWQ